MGQDLCRSDIRDNAAGFEVWGNLREDIFECADRGCEYDHICVDDAPLNVIIDPSGDTEICGFFPGRGAMAVSDRQH